MSVYILSVEIFSPTVTTRSEAMCIAHNTRRTMEKNNKCYREEKSISFPRSVAYSRTMMRVLRGVKNKIIMIMTTEMIIPHHCYTNSALLFSLRSYSSLFRILFISRLHITLTRLPSEVFQIVIDNVGQL